LEILNRIHQARKRGIKLNTDQYPCYYGTYSRILGKYVGEEEEVKNGNQNNY